MTNIEFIKEKLLDAITCNHIADGFLGIAFYSRIGDRVFNLAIDGVYDEGLWANLVALRFLEKAKRRMI
jgi:hypothetical protein